MQTGVAKPLTFCLVDNPLYLHNHPPLHMARLIAARLMLASTASIKFIFEESAPLRIFFHL